MVDALNQQAGLLMRKLTVGVVAVAGLLLTAGCSRTTPGNAQTTSPTAGSSSSGPAVPQVADPLDTTKFEKDPCGLLSPDQARALANLLTTRLDSKAAGGPICSWLDEHHNGISYSLIRGGGLSDVYRNHLPNDPGYFEPGESAAGYPAVYASITDGRPKGDCVLMVGVRNDVVMVTGSILGGTSPDQENPCPLVKKAAEAAIATLKAGL
ncbi:DUF3558 domain-containing protein [Amycolatopsis sp. NPDC059657]|uniref:DUF3558 domain-containing protein n=1 Tax=Amycolatopsis sp. NPDC059657 TaxID=3346899 RepID=UPI00367123AB